MKLIQIVDPFGVSSRCKRRLKRRTYHTKVWMIVTLSVQWAYAFCRDLIICGTQMATTSYHLLALPFMDVLMGKNYFTIETFYCCLFRFSRRLLWLKVGVTNHNPKVVVHHYLECVKKVGGKIYTICMFYTSLTTLGCPTVLRCDYGTENTSLATTQIAFRMFHNDSRSGENSFLYGPSKSNIVSYILGYSNYIYKK